MPPRRSIHALLSILFLALPARAVVAVTLDRPPKILEIHQVGTTVRLLWSPGGDDDGTLHEDIDSYALQRQIGSGSWKPIFIDDDDQGDGALEMLYVDDIDGLYGWGVAPTFKYRVVATTEDGVGTTSAFVAIAPAALRLDEAQDGKARLAWIPSRAPAGYPVHLGYVVQKKVAGFDHWVDLTHPRPPGMVRALSFIDPNTTTGASQYRVKTVYRAAAPGTVTTSFNSAPQWIAIHPLCEGQAAEPYPLEVIRVADGDSDGPDGDDIAAALWQCADEAYEDLRRPGGDGDGVFEPENGEAAIFGGCILRAEAVSYDDVAIRITSQPSCDDFASPTYPIHCVSADFPAGLVIEGQGRETVLRSPLWHSLDSPVPLPAPVLEVHRQDFRVTLRNLVLDGRKFEQRPPGARTWSAWGYGGLYVWNSGQTLDHVREISGDSLGDDDGYCDFERCVEAASGNDRDGLCEPGERCSEHPADVGVDDDNVCSTDRWTTAPGCESTKVADDGCLHNIEVRDIPGAHAVLINHANRWIIEDSEIYNVGCVNRGYGYDCPHFASAAEAAVPQGFKTFGTGLLIGEYTADFKVRRNVVQRATKYGLAFDNEKGSCNGLLRNHEVTENLVRDIGSAGIFNYGSVGARIHHNTIDTTTTWGAPPELNGNQGPFAMSLGGYCSDDNQFSDNDVFDSAGVGIVWNGSPETVTCSAPAGPCTQTTPVAGNRILSNRIAGTCVERDAGLRATPTYGFASIWAGESASGPLLLQDNELTDSRCRHSIQASGVRSASVRALNLTVAGGSYESGPNVVTYQQGGFYCGAVHVYGRGRKLVIADADVNHFVNADDAVPKVDVPEACAGHGATLVIDDVPAPYDAHFTPPLNVGSDYGPTTVVLCSDKPTRCDTACRLRYADCD